ncbi:unnamed protein product [Ilex paraguariensis]|uniref:Maturase K n=1 Tax=Ilex paraguariensis TaxID=185542 RepID=A0ABC8RSE2_9AQUA
MFNRFIRPLTRYYEHLNRFIEDFNWLNLFFNRLNIYQRCHTSPKLSFLHREVFSIHLHILREDRSTQELYFYWMLAPPTHHGSFPLYESRGWSFFGISPTTHATHLGQ